MNTKLLDDYIKDLNGELDKYTMKPTRVPLAHNFISCCLFKEINRVKDLRKAVKDIKDYGCKKVGDYLYAEIFLSPSRAYIQFSFSEGVPLCAVPMIHKRGLGIRRTDYIMVNICNRHHSNIHCIDKE